MLVMMFDVIDETINGSDEVWSRVQNNMYWIEPYKNFNY